MKTCSKEMRILLSRFPLRYHIICMIIHHIIHQLLTIMNSLFFDTLLSSYTCLRKLFYRLLNRFFCQRTHDSKILFFFSNKFIFCSKASVYKYVAMQKENSPFTFTSAFRRSENWILHFTTFYMY